VARRGGHRPRRFIIPHEVPVWIASGRWGPRRVHVGECAAVLTAERAYDELLRQESVIRPGCRFVLGWTLPDSTGIRDVVAELLPNAVWRCGRLFFRCGRCSRRATRLYVPTAGLEPRCRRCWGLSYQTQSWSYKEYGPLGWGRDICHESTAMRRKERRQAAMERYAARHAVLAAVIGRTQSPI